MTQQLLILSIALLVTVPLTAQTAFEFGFHAGTGLSALNYKLSQGNRKSGFGGDFGLDYTYFFNKQWGLGTGVGIGIYNSQATMNNTKSVIPGLIDEYNDVYDLRTTLDSYTEKQTATLLNIPLMLQFQTDFAGKRLYLRGGAKLGFPLRSNFQSSNATLTNKAYYIDTETESSRPAFMGLGTFTGRNVEKELPLKTTYSLALETGVKWTIEENLSLYTGIYFDYGLNDVRKEKGQTFIKQNSTEPINFKTGSITAPTDFTNKMSPLAVGVTLRLAFGKTIPKKIKVPKPKIKTKKGKHSVADTIYRVVPDASTDSLLTVLLSVAHDLQETAKELERQRFAFAEQQQAVKTEQQSQYDRAVTIIQEPITYFVIDRTDLLETTKMELNRKARQMEKYPDMKIIIEGHTCNLGVTETNLVIGQMRADVAKNYLVNQGIAPERIKTVSKAETEPLLPNTSEDNRRKNRRIEFVVEQ